MAYTVITVMILIASILLIGVVLVQNSKGGGLASSFSAQNNIMGVKKTTDFVEKATWTLVCAVVILSIASVYFDPRNQGVSEEESIINGVSTEMPAAVPQDLGTQAE